MSLDMAPRSSLARASCVQSSGEKDRSSPPPALEVAVTEVHGRLLLEVLKSYSF